MYPNIRTHLIARVQNLSIKDRNNLDTKLFLKKFPLIAYLQQLKYVLFLKRILLPVTIYIYILYLATCRRRWRLGGPRAVRVSDLK